MFTDFLNYLVVNKDGIELILKIGTFVISVFTLFGALIGGIRSIKDLSSNRKKKQLADFISRFSAKNEIKRLSGINSLPNYARSLFREMFFICSIESDAIIKELMFDALQCQSPHMKAQCIQINDFLVNYLLQHNCKSRRLDIITGNKEIIHILKHSETKRRIQFEINQRNPDSMFEQEYAVDNHVLLSSKLLASAMTKSFHEKLNGNLILESNMYASKWIYNSIQNCAIINNVTRHMFSLSTRYHFCIIQNNNYFDSRFMKTDFRKCTIRNDRFRSSKFVETDFCCGTIENTNLNQSYLKKCRFLQIAHIQTTFWNGCTIINSRFEQSRIISSEFCGTDFTASHFTDMQLWRNKFVGNFTACRFHNVKWGGSILKNVQFINCIFENTDFAGADLTHSKFINCQFTNTNFEKAKQEL